MAAHSWKTEAFGACTKLGQALPLQPEGRSRCAQASVRVALPGAPAPGRPGSHRQQWQRIAKLRGLPVQYRLAPSAKGEIRGCSFALGTDRTRDGNMVWFGGGKLATRTTRTGW
jgi:hypothetical protein